MTIREFTSSIINKLNSSSLDDKISREFIYSVAIEILKLIIKRETDSRKIFKNSSLFTRLGECVPMKEVSTDSCGISCTCDTLMRSVDKIPETFLSNFGSIITIFNQIKSIEYKEKTVNAYQNLRLQKYKPRTTKYFWIENGYIYIPDSGVENIIIYGLFSNIKELNDYLKKENPDKCYKILDSDFPIPGYLESTVSELTYNQLINIKKIPADEDANLNNNDKN